MINNVAEKIKYFRDKLGFTQTDLAKRLGISRSAVNAWEMGLSTPQLKHVIAMAEIFNTTVDGMLDTGEKKIVDITHLSKQEQDTVINMVNCLSNNNKK